ncbi:MAG: proline dehydrogenase family protein [Candidatus Thalassarchaeaceae archaeon]|jgi:proline dehydrogenase|nr:proline dehydrogenase family protein [Candidatus Thalassarchaeaceae archaeon]
MGLFGRFIVGITKRMPRFLVGGVARRYVAGKDLQSAVKVMKKLSSEGACFTVDVLGEEISNLEEAQFFIDEYDRVLAAIVEHNLDANLSIKPTAFGLLIDTAKAYENIERLLRNAAKNDIFVRLDMEDFRVTTPTIDIVIRMHEKGLTNVGTVLQSRLFRTSDDIKDVCEKISGFADFRICKGVYLESEDIAETEYMGIVNALNSHIDLIIENGGYAAIASHDLPVINHALTALNRNAMGPYLPDPRKNSPPDRIGKGPGYEFQMLLGVRGNIRRKLAKEGHRTRVYVPYGERWYEYSMRRLDENPDVAMHVVKSLFMPWTNRR